MCGCRGKGRAIVVDPGKGTWSGNTGCTRIVKLIAGAGVYDRGARGGLPFAVRRAGMAPLQGTLPLLIT